METVIWDVINNIIEGIVFVSLDTGNGPCSTVAKHFAGVSYIQQICSAEEKRIVIFHCINNYE